MRILLVADANSTHTRRWSSALNARGHEVHLATLRDGTCQGARVHHLPTYNLGKPGYLLAVAALRRVAASVSPDVVHAHYITSYGFLAGAAGVHPLVVTAWGSDVLFPPRARPIRRWLGRGAFRAADVITTVAEHMNGRVREIAGADVSVHTIPFGVDLGVFRFGPLPLDEGPFRIICTRNFHPLYDVESVVRAFAILRKSVISHLTLVGEGPQRETLARLAAENNMTRDVQFTGHISAEALAIELAKSHVFVTSAHSDGNNVSLNEAMAVGCFPVATDIPANTQWIDNGVNGIVYPAGDAAALASALQSAWSDIPRYRRAAAINREIVEKRGSWDACVDATIALYEAAIMQRAGSL